MSDKRVESFLAKLGGNVSDPTWMYNGMAAIASVEYQQAPVLIIDWRGAKDVLAEVVPDVANFGIRVFPRSLALKVVKALDEMTGGDSQTTTAVKKMMANYDPEQVPILVLSGQGTSLRRQLLLVNPFTYPDDKTLVTDHSSDSVDAIRRLKSMDWYSKIRKSFRKHPGEPKVEIINWNHSKQPIPVITVVSLENKTTWGVFHFFGNPDHAVDAAEAFIYDTWGGGLMTTVED